jgi:hypothetical protein
LALRLNAPPVENEPGLVIGWGLSEESAPLFEGHYSFGPARHQLQLDVTGVGPETYSLPSGGMLRVDAHSFVTDPGGCYGDSGAPFISTETGAVVGVLSTAEPSDPTISASQTISDCLGSPNVFRSVMGQADWLVDAFQRAGQAPRFEGFAPPAAPGHDCRAPEECLSGICLAAGDQRFCSQDCDVDACPSDMQCVGATGARECVPTTLNVSASSAGCTLVHTTRPADALGLLAAVLLLRLRRNPWSKDHLDTRRNMS